MSPYRRLACDGIRIQGRCHTRTDDGRHTADGIVKEETDWNQGQTLKEAYEGGSRGGRIGRGIGTRIRSTVVTAVAVVGVGVTASVSGITIIGGVGRGM